MRIASRESLECASCCSIKKKYGELRYQMMIIMKHNRAKQKLTGQALVEFALLLPLLLVLIISTLEFGRLFYTKIVITNAAREGAYYLATHLSDLDESTDTSPNTVLAAEAEASNSGVDAITVDITTGNCCKIGEYSVEVTVSTNVQDLFFLGFVANSLSLTATRGDFPLSSSVEMMVQ